VKARVLTRAEVTEQSEKPGGLLAALVYGLLLELVGLAICTGIVVLVLRAWSALR
jgi:hypothetical protein